MTVPAHAKKFGESLPSGKDREAANQLRKIIAAQQPGNVHLHVFNDKKQQSEVVLTPAVSALLTEVLRFVGQGDAVTLVPVSKMLTTQQAADILNVSRPFFIKLLDEGKIEHSFTGRHRRIKAETLFEYKDLRAKERDKALSDIAEFDAEFI